MAQPRPFVPDAAHDAVALAVQLHPDVSVRRRVLHGVRQEVVENRGGEHAVGTHGPHVAVKTEDQFDALVFRGAPVVCAGALDQARQVDVLESRRQLDADRVVHQLAHGVVHQIVRVSQPFEPYGHLTIGMVTQHRQQQLDDTARDGQEAVQCVRGERDRMDVDCGQQIELHDRVLEILLRASDRSDRRVLRIARLFMGRTHHGRSSTARADRRPMGPSSNTARPRQKVRFSPRRACDKKRESDRE